MSKREKFNSQRIARFSIIILYRDTPFSNGSIRVRSSASNSRVTRGSLARTFTLSTLALNSTRRTRASSSKRSPGKFARVRSQRQTHFCLKINCSLSLSKFHFVKSMTLSSLQCILTETWAPAELLFYLYFYVQSSRFNNFEKLLERYKRSFLTYSTSRVNDPFGVSKFQEIPGTRRWCADARQFPRASNLFRGASRAYVCAYLSPRRYFAARYPLARSLLARR